MSWKTWTPRRGDGVSPELYFQKGTSNKFWRIAQDGRKTWTFYGRIEAGEDNERMLEKLHKSTASAKAYALSKYREKVRGGYTAVYDSVKAGRVDLFYGTKRGARSGLSSAVWAAAGKKKPSVSVIKRLDPDFWQEKVVESDIRTNQGVYLADDEELEEMVQWNLSHKAAVVSLNGLGKCPGTKIPLHIREGARTVIK